MPLNSKKDYSGIYMPNDGVGAGHLHIAGADTLLTLVDKEPWKEVEAEFRDHHGVLTDGTKASLLGCISAGRINHRWDENARYEVKLFPHYILAGEAFISSQDAVVRALHYTFENIHCLVHNFGTFGSIHPERDELLELLKANHERSARIAEKRGRTKAPFAPEVGEHPLLLYYADRWEIAKCLAQIGTVTLTNRASHSMGSSKGVGIDNEIVVSLEFAAPRTVEDAINALWTLHSFFELCLGRRQRYLKIDAELTTAKPEKDGHPPPLFELIWSYCNDQVSGETQPTSYGDVLLDIGKQKAEFAKVLSGWLDSAHCMVEARGRFGSAFYTESYGIDRIVGAANMFDLLPESHVPKRVSLDQSTKDAVGDCRRLFKALPESFARQSVLSALGRVGTASLRDKACHRANILMAAYPQKFSELHLPCSQAVLCRNHFVHGSEAAFDYREEINALAFLTETLEFVFAASDLIELGWDFDSWRSKGSSLTHAFGSYVVNYEQNLQRLKTILKA